MWLVCPVGLDCRGAVRLCGGLWDGTNGTDETYGTHEFHRSHKSHQPYISHSPRSSPLRFQLSHYRHSAFASLLLAPNVVSRYTPAIMQPYDILMLVVVVAATLFGVWKGMAWQVASLASVVVSTLVAIHSSTAVADYFPGQPPWNRYLAMAVLYAVTAGAIWLTFRLVSNIIDRVKLQEFDRQLGATFGLAKGILYCVVITFFAVTLSESSRKLVLESRSGDWIARGIRNANPILPEDVRTHLGTYIDQLDEKLHAPLPVDEKQVEPAAKEASKTSSPDSPKEPPKTPAAPASQDSRGPVKKLGQLLRGK
jgi:membrane protein required for colicin V production